MKKNRVKSLLIALTMACPIFSPVQTAAVSVDSSGITQADTALDYSAGTLKAGSYLGYGYEDKMNYTSQTELEAAGYILSGTGTYGTILFTDGKPVLNKTASGASLTVTGVTPATDQNGITLPNSAPTYTQVQYALSKATAACSYITLGMTGSTGSGQTQIHNGTSKAAANAIAMQYGTQSSGGGTESYIAVSDFYNASDVISVRALMEYGGADKNHMWIWAWNENKGIAKGDPQVNNLFPRYGQTNAKAGGFKFEINKDTADSQLTIQNVKVYEKYEMLFRDTVSKVEANMLGSNASFNLVQSNLNLPTEVTGLDLGETASIAWTSSNPNVLETNGVVHFNAFAQENVQLTGAYTIGGKTKNIVYNIYVQEIPTDDKQLDNAMSKLTWSMLSSQPQAGVTQNLTLPGSVTNNYGSVVPVAWSVESGGDSVIINGSSAVVTMSETQDVPAVIRATFTYGSATSTMDFDFTILKNELIYFANTDYTAKGTAEITAEDGITVTSSGDAESYVKFVDGCGLRANGDNSKMAVAAVDFAKQVESKGYLSEYNSLESDLTYEFEVNTEALSTSLAYESQVLLKNASGKMIAFLQFAGGNRSTGGANGTINIKQNNAWSNGITLAPAFIANYRAAFANGIFPRVKVKVVYNRMTTKYNLYLKLPADADYTLFYQDALPTETTVAAGDTVTTLTITTTANTSRAAAINLYNVKIYSSKDEIISYITQNITESMLLNGQDKTNVRKSLASSVLSGTNLVWQLVSSSYNGTLFDSNGTLLVKLAEGEAYEAVVKPVITFTSEKLADLAIPTEAIAITVCGYDDKSLAYGKKITVSGASAASGSSSANINDGTSKSTFLTTGAETTFNAVIDLAANTLVSDIVVREGHDTAYNIAAYTIEGSSDKKNWETLSTGAQIGDIANILLPDPYASCRYIKFTVASKITENKPVSIGEIMLYFNPGESYKQTKDFESLAALPTSVSDHFYLQGTGAVYGNAISWASGNEEVLSVASAMITDTASENYGKYKVTYIKPALDTVVTFTCTVGGNTMKYSVTAKGKNVSGGGSGGSGGGSSVSSGVVSYVPSVPQTQQPAKTGKYYDDLDRAPWAASYIDGLTDLGIVSGDGTGHFYPTRSVTREEFIKMLVLALDMKPDYNTQLSFADLDADSWAYPYIAAAYSSGIVNGISAERFGIGSEISRQDMAVMTIRGLQKNSQIQNEDAAQTFTDANDIDGYAAQSVSLAKAMGLLSGDESGRFLPKNSATRAESAKILYNIVK